MLTVVQRVTAAHVTVEDKTVGAIKQGLLILCGFEAKDDVNTLDRMLAKSLAYRIFHDVQGKMNLGLESVKGGLLLVPQFTLVADTQKGLRPGFSKGATPEHGRYLFEELVQRAKATYPLTACGVFGADMQVHLCNDGPATFLMQF